MEFLQQFLPILIYLRIDRAINVQKKQMNLAQKYRDLATKTSTMESKIAELTAELKRLQGVVEKLSNKQSTTVQTKVSDYKHPVDPEVCTFLGHQVSLKHEEQILDCLTKKYTTSGLSTRMDLKFVKTFLNSSAELSIFDQMKNGYCCLDIAGAIIEGFSGKEVLDYLQFKELYFKFFEGSDTASRVRFFYGAIRANNLPIVRGMVNDFEDMHNRLFEYNSYVFYLASSCNSSEVLNYLLKYACDCGRLHETLIAVATHYTAIDEINIPGVGTEPLPIPREYNYEYYDAVNQMMSNAQSIRWCVNV